jgi:hypothetical protein
LEYSMARTVQLDSELRIAAHHVSYGIEMLVHTGFYLVGFYSSPMVAPDGNDKRMALESFLLHFRTLRAFLCPSLQAYKTEDIIASDFLKEDHARDLGNSTALSQDQDPIEKMLAHLTYGRTPHEWNVPQMLELMLGELEAFFAMLPPEAREWFPAAQWLAESRARADALLHGPIADRSMTSL